MVTKYLTVTQVTQALKSLIEEHFSLTGIWIQGEISNFTCHSSGHCYLTLKDAGARLSCVIFRSQASELGFKPSDGQQVLARGRISIYEKSGQYQLYIEELQPAGLGQLYLAFERLKEQLAREGLFDQARKRPLPALPQQIGLITSPTGAALHDMIKVLRRRRPNLDLLVIPAQVQGAEAPASLVAALELAARLDRLDLVIIGRGGGSLEELAAFNDERVARAIAAFPKPIIAAVGHETDVTIADFVADLRAPTPSAAAELAVPDQAAWQRSLELLQQRLVQAGQRGLVNRRSQLERLLTSRAWAFPKEPLDRRRQELDLLGERMIRWLRHDLSLKRESYSRVLGKLDTLSPLATLQRGYAIAQTLAGKVVRYSDQVEPDQILRLILARGRLRCRVLDKESGP